MIDIIHNLLVNKEHRTDSIVKEELIAQLTAGTPWWNSSEQISAEQA